MKTCPCGSSKTFSQCCDRYLNQGKKAPTPETLMRSRYTAFVLTDIHYIEKTMCDKAAQNFNAIETLHFAQSANWQGLQIHQVHQHADNIGFVTFTAYYQDEKGQPQYLSEKSEFHCIDNQWFYTDGSPNIEYQAQHHSKLPANTEPYKKVGRNAPCHCGSGIKFKKCCG